MSRKTWLVLLTAGVIGVGAIVAVHSGMRAAEDKTLAAENAAAIASSLQAAPGTGTGNTVRSTPVAAPGSAPDGAQPRRTEAPGAIANELAASSRLTRVEFSLPTRMELGETYEARLFIGSGAGQGVSSDEKPAISTEVMLANRVRAMIESAHLKIERLSSEWQELHGTAPGLWVWRVEPVRRGQVELFVTVQHGLVVDGIERNVTAQRFPQKVVIDVTLWQQTRRALAGASPATQVLTAVTTALGAIGTAVWATWGFWRDRRKQKKQREAEGPQARARSTLEPIHPPRQAEMQPCQPRTKVRELRR